MNFFIIPLLLIFLEFVVSSLHRSCIPNCEQGVRLSSEYSHNLETRAAVDSSLNVIVFLRGSRSVAAAYHGGNLDLFSLADFEEIDSYEIEEGELSFTDGIIKYNEDEQKVFVLVNPWDDTAMGNLKRSVFFFSVSSSSLSFIGKSSYSSDLENSLNSECYSEQVLWFGTRIYTLMSGEECHAGSFDTPSSAIWMYDTDIQGFSGSAQAYTTRTSFTYFGKRILLWYNEDEGEDRLLVFDFDAGLHEYDLDLSLQSSDDKISESVYACDYVAIGNLNNSISDFDSLKSDIIYVVYSYESTSTYYFIVYDLKNRESLQSFEVNDVDSSYSPNAPSMIFVDQDKWILYVFGIFATMKFRIDPSTHLFSSTTPYKIERLSFTNHAEGDTAGPAYFFPPSLVGMGNENEGDPMLYRTFAISHDGFCEDPCCQDEGGGFSGCDTTLYELNFYSCSFGYYVDNATMTNNQYEQIDIAVPSNSDLCQRTPDGYFATEHDSLTLTTCDLGGYPEKLSQSMNCTSCDLGYYSPVPILDSSNCLACPEGTYSSVSWVSSVGSCTPCPENTFGVIEGASALSQCESCGDPEEYYCGLGATEKIPVLDVTIYPVYPKLVLEDTSEDGNWMGTFLIKLFCSLGIVFGAILLFFCTFQVLCCWDSMKDVFEIIFLPISCLLCPIPTLKRKVIVFGDGKSTGLKKSEMIKCNRGCSNFCEFFRSMRTLDYFFSMEHDVGEGESPIKRKTGCGGVMSFFALSMFSVLLTLSIVEFSSGFKEEVTTTKLYFQGEDLIEDYGEFRFYYTLYGIFDDCEGNANLTTHSGFQVRNEDGNCVELSGHSGCTCSWICEECSIADSNLIVNFEFDTGGKYITFVEYNISVPHYIEDETFDLVSGVIEQNQEESNTISQLDLEVALFKSMRIKISDWSILLDFLPTMTSTGLSVSQLSSVKTLSSVTDAEGKFTLEIDMKLSNMQFIVEEVLRMSLLGILGQVFALFSFSIAVGRVLFGVLGGSCSSVKDVCCCVGWTQNVVNKLWICRLFRVNKKNKDDEDDFEAMEEFYETRRRRSKSRRRRRRRKRREKKRRREERMRRRRRTVNNENTSNHEVRQQVGNNQSINSTNMKHGNNYYSRKKNEGVDCSSTSYAPPSSSSSSSSNTSSSSDGEVWGGTLV